MSRIGRREFGRRVGRTIVALSGGAAAAAALEARRPRRAVAASERVVLATIGCGGRGRRLTRDFAARADCAFAWLCDVDSRRSAAAVGEVEGRQSARPRRSRDLREVLDDRDVDAVVVATPDHWHALATVLACRAGKDVYVEKPASYSIVEGRKMVQAARRHARVVQVGTQNRSAPYCQEALAYIRAGGLGEIRLAKVFNLKPGSPFHAGRAGGSPPPEVDYDRWLGPAPERPFLPGRFHGGWYYWWDYCGGDMGNDGIHQLDLCRWLVGVDHPRAVSSMGGNLAFDDDREVPDTQVATFDCGGLVMTFEMTNWPPYMKKTNNQTRIGDTFPLWSQNATRIELYGTRRQMLIGRHGGGWQVLEGEGRVVEQRFGRFPDAPHKENFLSCVRSRARPSADIEEGHRSAIFVHLGNISYRLGGRRLLFDGKRETFPEDAEARRYRERDYREGYAVPGES